MKKHIFSCLLAFVSLVSYAQTRLSEDAQISLLTCSPSDEAVYTLYGHTAIRVRDVIQIDSVNQRVLDTVFNYGIFDFSKPNFIYRFVKGETDYRLEAYDFKHFLPEYEMRGSEVYEQVLNLTYEEKAALWQALLINLQPENKVYRYNFFYDNCSTRPAVLVERCIDGSIAYSDHSMPKTFREMINHCTRNEPWVTFGCDLIVGYPADRIATVHESFFIPDYLKNAYSEAWIIRADGTKRKLVSEETILATVDAEDVNKQPTVFTPFIVTSLFFLLILLITLFEWRKKTYFRWLDCLLFFVAGLAGCIIFFLSFISEHPSMWPNISIIWLHPLHLIGVVLFAVKKLNKAAYCYHFINFVALFGLLPVWFFIPQHLNIAFIPLIASLWLRSEYCLLRKKVSIV
ncbi:MAG: DUF4105 domain-containing protein [Tannerella sp.]|nr:DUF4105 domain-containing protein [Tannerella sp.]